MEKNTDFLTIKEFAEASGRSQQTIYKQISTRLSAYLHEIEGQKFIERKALAEVFHIGVQPEENNSFNSGNNREQLLYDMLKAELEAKNRQLEAKDKQIEQLQTELSEERKHSRELTDRVAVLAEQAQALHAGTIKTQLPSSKEGASETAAAEENVVLEPEPKKGFLEWLKELLGAKE